MMASSPASLSASSPLSIQASGPQVSSTNLPYSNSPAISSSPVNLSGQPNASSDNRLTSSKEGFHATAVSHLKDKILRKYDSMENLSKIGKDSPVPVGGTGSNPNPSGPGQWSKSSSPIIQISQSSTIDLNRELATKLTLSSTSPPAMMTATPPSSSSSSPATKTSSAQGLMCPFSNQNASTVSPVAIVSTSSAFSQPDIFSSLHSMSQIPRMLTSQEVHHAPLPVYHSMQNRQYPNSTQALTNHQTVTSDSPLSDMQQMLVRGPAAMDDPNGR